MCKFVCVLFMVHSKIGCMWAQADICWVRFLVRINILCHLCMLSYVFLWKWCTAFTCQAVIYTSSYEGRATHHHSSRQQSVARAMAVSQTMIGCWQPTADVWVPLGPGRSRTEDVLWKTCPDFIRSSPAVSGHSQPGLTQALTHEGFTLGEPLWLHKQSSYSMAVLCIRLPEK